MQKGIAAIPNVRYRLAPEPAKGPKVMRYAPLITYIRVATSGQGRSGLGIEAQRHTLVQFARAEGYELAREFVADPIETQRGNEGHGLPMAVRHHCMEALASRSPATQRRHVGFDPGFVGEHQPRGVNFILTRLPALPLAGDVGSILLGGPACFF
jgi:hypothetical protein